MEIQAECMSCFLSQVLKSMRLLRPNIENGEIVKVQKKVMRKIIHENHIKLPYYGKIVYQTIAEEIKAPDPYRSIKQRDNNLVQSLIPKIKQVLKSSSDPLFTAVKLMVIGNTIDFGAPHNFNIEEDLNKIEDATLNSKIMKQFRQKLTQSRVLFIIGDNCGEAVFDKIFIEFIQKHYPSIQIIYGVRGGPAINDITRIEADEIGLSEICKVVEGSLSPGVIFEEVSSEFIKVFQNADLIISKGQGNFESLEGISKSSKLKPKGSLFYLLKAKCSVVAGIFNVPIGTLIFEQEKLSE
ncbi:damage-control phosphatase ARMT1 family protein [Candidatus Harpocratesius sp.]